MNRSKLNYWIDVGLAISFLAVAVTGIIKFPLIIRYLGLRGTEAFSRMSFIHDWAGVVLTLLVLIHLILHWNWIKTMTKDIFKNEK